MANQKSICTSTHLSARRTRDSSKQSIHAWKMFCLNIITWEEPLTIAEVNRKHNQSRTMKGIQKLVSSNHELHTCTYHTAEEKAYKACIITFYFNGVHDSSYLACCYCFCAYFTNTVDGSSSNRSNRSRSSSSNNSQRNNSPIYKM